jgi:putative transposase
MMLSVRLPIHLSGRITELALERRRFGYRRIWQLLRREGLHVYRIYHLNGLRVRRRRRRKGLATERFALLRPDAPNQTWSMDFVMEVLASVRRIKCLICEDDFTKAATLLSVFQAFRSRVFWTASRCFGAILRQ